jgi:hypothetical protein
MSVSVQVLVSVSVQVFHDQNQVYLSFRVHARHVFFKHAKPSLIFILQLSFCLSGL